MKTFVITIACVISAVLAILLFAELTTAQEEELFAPAPPALDIAGRVANERNLTTFVSALRAADLEDLLRSRGPLTVFVPDNAAFAKLPPGALQDLLTPQNKKRLTRTLKLHVIGGAVSSKDLKPGKFKTDEGSKVRVSVDNNTVSYGAAKVVAADIQASNGMIHIIDTVIVPD